MRSCEEGGRKPFLSPDAVAKADDCGCARGVLAKTVDLVVLFKQDRVRVERRVDVGRTPVVDVLVAVLCVGVERDDRSGFRLCL